MKKEKEEKDWPETWERREKKKGEDHGQGGGWEGRTGEGERRRSRDNKVKKGIREKGWAKNRETREEKKGETMKREREEKEGQGSEEGGRG